MGYSVPEHFAALAAARPHGPSPPFFRAGRRRLRRAGDCRATLNPASRVAALAAVASAAMSGRLLLHARSRPAGRRCSTSPLFVELLRARPRLVFWVAALARPRCGRWCRRCSIAAPPGDAAAGARDRPRIPARHRSRPAARLLAGRDRLPHGGGMFGVYLLSQICVVVTYWAVFALGRAIVGDAHAVLAVLLMVGIAVFTVPTPEFGPGILAMPLWALVLLHYWRAVGEGRTRLLARACASVSGLLLLTTYAGHHSDRVCCWPVTLRAARGRGAIRHASIHGLRVVVVDRWFPHLIWLARAADGALAPGCCAAIAVEFAAPRRRMALISVDLRRPCRRLALRCWWLAPWRLPRGHRAPPTVAAGRSQPAAPIHVYFFALVPALAATAAARVCSAAPVASAAAPAGRLSGPCRDRRRPATGSGSTGNV